MRKVGNKRTLLPEPASLPPSEALSPSALSTPIAMRLHFDSSRLLSRPAPPYPALLLSIVCTYRFV